MNVRNGDGKLSTWAKVASATVAVALFVGGLIAMASADRGRLNSVERDVRALQAQQERVDERLRNLDLKLERAIVILERIEKGKP